jgi:phosphatidylglycerol lysyltransferase
MPRASGAMTAVELARRLVLDYGYNATSYQILNPGFEYWFDEKETAVVAFAEHNGVRVVAGVPVCADERIGEVAAQFERASRSAGCDVAYFAVEARAAALWKAGGGRTAIVIGAQPVWHPREFVEVMRRHSSLRAQLNRATNKGVVVEEWSCDRAEHSTELRAVLDEWLERRGLPPLHFLVEPDTLPSLLDRHIFVATQNARVVGFLVAAPIRQRGGWLVEQNVRANSAPNGTTEILLFSAAEWMRDHGSDLITLGLAPLSRHAPPSETEPPPTVRALFAWARIHGRRFYNFEGLDTFKAKFRPTAWEPIYMVLQRPDHAWRALAAIGGVFGGASILSFGLRVVVHAVGQEYRRLRARI